MFLYFQTSFLICFYLCYNILVMLKAFFPYAVLRQAVTITHSDHLLSLCIGHFIVYPSSSTLLYLVAFQKFWRKILHLSQRYAAPHSSNFPYPMSFSENFQVMLILHWPISPLSHCLFLHCLTQWLNLGFQVCSLIYWPMSHRTLG